jgi:hypothetical protein
VPHHHRCYCVHFALQAQADLFSVDDSSQGMSLKPGRRLLDVPGARDHARFYLHVMYVSRDNGSVVTETNLRAIQVPRAVTSSPTTYSMTQRLNNKRTLPGL